MNVVLAAERTLDLMEQHFHDRCSTSGSLNYGPEKANMLHMRHMAKKIRSGEVMGEKAHRWLGWMQAVAYLCGAATHEQCQMINKDS